MRFINSFTTFLLLLAITIIATSFTTASWFTSFKKAVNDDEDNQQDEHHSQHQENNINPDNEAEDQTHHHHQRRGMRNGGGGGGIGFFRRLQQQEEQQHLQNNNNDEDDNDSSPTRIGRRSSRSKIFFEEEEEEQDYDASSSLESRSPIGIGSTTGSVLGPHTPRDEAATQRNLKRQQSAPAKLLREWELKGTHHHCWKTAVLRLRALCEDVLTDKLKRTKLAMEFMACQLELDGKDATAARCFDEDDLKAFSSCASALPDALYPIKVQFDHHVDTLCFHLQEELLHDRTRQIVDRLGVASSQAARNLAELSVKSGQIDRTMQTMHVSQKQAVASAETLAFALRQVNDLGVEIKVAFENDKVGIEAVTDKVQSLLETHELMKRSNEALANSLKILSDDHVRAVSALGTEVDATRSKLLAGMEGLTSLQAKTSRFIGSLDAAVHYVFVFILIWVVTTAPRTQDSRFAAILAGPVSSLLAERYVLRGFLKMFSLFGICTNPDFILEAHEYRFRQMHQQQRHQQYGMNGFADMMNDATSSSSSFSSYTGDDQHHFAGSNNKANILLDPTPLRNFFLIVAFVVIFVYAYLWQSPEERQRRILQIELRRALGRALSVDNNSNGDDAHQSSENNGVGKRRVIVPRLVSSMERTTTTNDAEAQEQNQEYFVDSGAKKKRASSKK